LIRKIFEVSKASARAHSTPAEVADIVVEKYIAVLSRD
jgi:hypothetical protein